MDPVTIGIGVLKLATDLLKDDAAMSAIFNSNDLSEEQKEAIRAMRSSLENKWDSLAPKD